VNCPNRTVILSHRSTNMLKIVHNIPTRRTAYKNCQGLSSMCVFFTFPFLLPIISCSSEHYLRCNVTKHILYCDICGQNKRQLTQDNFILSKNTAVVRIRRRKLCVISMAVCEINVRDEVQPQVSVIHA
jgi:hypothetical protein